MVQPAISLLIEHTFLNFDLRTLAKTMAEVEKEALQANKEEQDEEEDLERREEERVSAVAPREVDLWCFCATFSVLQNK